MWRRVIASTVSVAGLVLVAPALAAPGDLVLASSSATGTKGNAESIQVDVSADGSAAAFATLATNFDPADTDSVFDV